jgi:hypothetical protein
VLDGDNITVDASEVGIFRAGGLFHLSAGPGAAVSLRGGKDVQINPASTPTPLGPEPVPLGAADRPNGGPHYDGATATIGAPHYPKRGPVAPPPPLGFPEIEVKDDNAEEPARPAERRALRVEGPEEAAQAVSRPANPFRFR